MSVIGHRVGRHHHRRRRLVDRVGDRRVPDVVVVRSPCEVPGVSRIRARVGVRRIADVHSL